MNKGYPNPANTLGALCLKTRVAATVKIGLFPVSVSLVTVPNVLRKLVWKASARDRTIDRELVITGAHTRLLHADTTEANLARYCSIPPVSQSRERDYNCDDTRCRTTIDDKGATFTRKTLAALERERSNNGTA